MILTLAGGVGGAKMVCGLASHVSPADLLIVVNTGDDFTHLGLRISPDVDTVLYWLAGINDRERGWGLKDETWNVLEGIRALEGPSWFALGDRDLATHLLRTNLLNQGHSLSEVTRHLNARFNVRHLVAPMTDDSVRTIVNTDEGKLEFQNYFVFRRCEPRVHSVEYVGASGAKPSAAFDAALIKSRARRCDHLPF